MYMQLGEQDKQVFWKSIVKEIKISPDTYVEDIIFFSFCYTVTSRNHQVKVSYRITKYDRNKGEVIILYKKKEDVSSALFYFRKTDRYSRGYIASIAFMCSSSTRNKCSKSAFRAISLNSESGSEL